MQITIDTHTTTPQECKALMRLLLDSDAVSGETLAPALTMGALLEASPITLTGIICQRGPQFTTAQITDMLESLNKELYSRREIKPEDNPASGVAAATLNSDAPMLMTGDAARAMDDTMHGGDSFAKTEVIVGAGVDLAAVFGAANADTPPPTTTQLDKNGLPWDSRIHAASKAINADGTWRQKRGVADATVTTVEAELRQAMSVPNVSALVCGFPAPPGVNMVMLDDTHGSPELDADAAKLTAMGGDAGPTLGQIIPPPPPVTAPPAPPAPPAPAGDPTTFPELVTFIAAQKVAGKLNQTHVQAALTAIGIEGALPVINSRLDLLPALVAKLRQIGGA